MDILHNVGNCYSWRTATVHELGFSLRGELNFASTPGHHADYLNGLRHHFDESWCIKTLESDF